MNQTYVPFWVLCSVLILSAIMQFHRQEEGPRRAHTILDGPLPLIMNAEGFTISKRNR